MIIADGAGKGRWAEVDKNQRLQTKSVSLSSVEASATQGDTYNINTGTIALTSANKSAVLYLKNNGENDLNITSIGFLLGNSTGGSGDLTVEVVRGPTGGTIVSSATDVSININKNFGSTKEIVIDAFKGVEASTLTGGTAGYSSLLNGSAKQYTIATGTLVLPRGSSIGVNITPQTGNTAMNVQVFFAVTEFLL